MSYEGYTVYYCKNGHRIGSWDVYDVNYPEPQYGDSRELECPICGCMEVITDSVNQTNGCECKYCEEGEKCGCHESVVDIAGWTPIDCFACEGNGDAIHPIKYVEEDCSICAGKNPACGECYGTGKIRECSGYVNSECYDCEGTGKRYVEVWDLSPLNRG